jgi:hypothetical protein
VRGKVRAWKQKFAQDHAVFERGITMLHQTDIVLDFVKRAGKGRDRALDKIQRALGPGVTLERSSVLDGKPPHAVFSTMRPRGSVAVDVRGPDATTAEVGSLMQDCVTVDYAVVGFIGSDAVHSSTCLQGWPRD